MHRKRPGRRAHRVRLPGTTAIIGVALLTSCTSSGQDSSSTPPPTSHAVTESSSPSQTPIALPSPTSTATKRHVARPAGLPRLSAAACSSAADEVEGELIAMRIVFRNAKISRALAMSNFAGLAKFVPPDRAAVVTMRRHWLTAGYPATFPTVRDTDNMISALDQFLVAIKGKKLAAVPQIYLDLNSASDQYSNDINTELCLLG
jgi:hypothetical protein